MKMSNLGQNSGKSCFSSVAKTHPGLSSTDQKQQQEQRADAKGDPAAPAGGWEPREVQVGGGLRTGVVRPRGFGEVSVTPELPRSAGCYLRASWAANCELGPTGAAGPGAPGWCPAQCRLERLHQQPGH